MEEREERGETGKREEGEKGKGKGRGLRAGCQR